VVYGSDNYFPKLLIASAEAAINGGERPEELNKAIESRFWGSLPSGGGLDDQPAGLLAKMRVSLNVFDSFTQFNSAMPGTKAAWVLAHQGAWELICLVEEMMADG
jgi:hypothetical protein